MKVRAKVNGVNVPAGHVALRAGETLDVSEAAGKILLAAGVVEPAGKPEPRGKRLPGAPENK